MHAELREREREQQKKRERYEDEEWAVREDENICVQKIYICPIDDL